VERIDCSRAMENFKEGSDVDIALKGEVNSLTAAEVKYALEAGKVTVTDGDQAKKRSG